MTCAFALSAKADNTDERRAFDVSKNVAKNPDENVIQDHLAQMKLNGMADTTIVARGALLRRFYAVTGIAPTEADLGTVRRFLTATKITADTRGIYIGHLRKFYAWAVEEGYLQENPVIKLASPKRKKGMPHPIPATDLVRAIHTASPRVRVWLMLGAFAGLRCVEMARLQGQDVILDDIPRLIVHGKGGKIATVPCHPVLVAELGQWRREGWLFPRRFDENSPIHAASISDAVRRHLSSLGIGHSAHATRHLFATTAYRESGHDLLLTAGLLRHDSVATTQIYAQTDPVDAANVVRSLRFGLIEEVLAQTNH